MTGEEAGPAGPKVIRLLYFTGAGFIFTAAINKWRELEQNSIQKQQQQEQQQQQKFVLSESSASAVPKAVK